METLKQSGANTDKNPSRKQYKFSLNNTRYEWERYITGAQLRQLENIPNDHSIYQTVKGNEMEIEDTQTVDLEPGGTEHFTTRQNPARHEVLITVNNQHKKIHRGNQAVSEIKRVGGVPASDELEQLIDGKLTPLKDSGSVVIKGGEVFFSHVRDGASA